MEKYEEEQKLLMKLENMALEKSQRNLKTKVLKALTANVKISLEAKEIERDHQHRKAQIDNFFENLKKKVETESKEKAEAKADQESREYLKDKARRHAKNVAIIANHCTDENLEAKIAEEVQNAATLQEEALI